ncbi:MAG: type II toxin-antitoxin system Phd/YefM family antitoxin [Thiothrix sp.]|nr:MAG: type II toxin-antitoxin system Phd/YefM family antitoxin [Thiothrix sp.]
MWNRAPQIVNRHGAETAILVPIDVWKRLKVVAKPPLKDLLLADSDMMILCCRNIGKLCPRPLFTHLLAHQFHV